jgi:hypothetical protein
MLPVSIQLPCDNSTVKQHIYVSAFPGHNRRLPVRSVIRVAQGMGRWGENARRLKSSRQDNSGMLVPPLFRFPRTYEPTLLFVSLTHAFSLSRRAVAAATESCALPLPLIDGPSRLVNRQDGERGERERVKFLFPQAGIKSIRQAGRSRNKIDR